MRLRLAGCEEGQGAAAATPGMAVMPKALTRSSTERRALHVGFLDDGGLAENPILGHSKAIVAAVGKSALAAIGFLEFTENSRLWLRCQHR